MNTQCQKCNKNILHDRGKYFERGWRVKTWHQKTICCCLFSPSWHLAFVLQTITDAAKLISSQHSKIEKILLKGQCARCCWYRKWKGTTLWFITISFVFAKIRQANIKYAMKLWKLILLLYEGVFNKLWVKKSDFLLFNFLSINCRLCTKATSSL